MTSSCDRREPFSIEPSRSCPAVWPAIRRDALEDRPENSANQGKKTRSVAESYLKMYSVFRYRIVASTNYFDAFPGLLCARKYGILRV